MGSLDQPTNEVRSKAGAFTSFVTALDATTVRCCGKGFVVLLDVVEVVEIVHHQPVRLPEAVLGHVGEPVDPLEPRAVAEMETRDRIDRRAVARLGVEEIKAPRRAIPGP